MKELVAVNYFGSISDLTPGILQAYDPRIPCVDNQSKQRGFL